LYSTKLPPHTGHCISIVSLFLSLSLSIFFYNFIILGAVLLRPILLVIKKDKINIPQA
jgi:hypothetical protein